MQISDERIAHSHGVAEYMYAHAEEYGLNPKKMYLLGLVHDIGYISGKQNHEERGADLLLSAGLSPNLVSAVCHHEERLSEIKPYPSKELLLLAEADMHVMTYEQRLEDIAKRQGWNSKAFRTCEENVRYLRMYKAQQERERELEL